MRTGEVFDLALRCYQRLGWTYLRLTLIPTLLCLTAYLFVTQALIPSLFLTSHANSQNAQIGEAIITVALTLFAAAPLFLIGLSWSTCVVTQLVSDTLLGNSPSATAAIATARRSIGRVFGANLYQLFFSTLGLLLSAMLLMTSGLLTQITASDNLIAGVVAVVGSFGILVGAILFLVGICRYALAPPISVLEGAGAKVAARRSVQLQKTLGYHPAGAGTVLGLIFLCGLVYLLIDGGIGSTFGMVGVRQFLNNLFAGIPSGGVFLQALRILPSFLALWTVIPFWSASITILYYERRVRLEGYDIEALAADVWRTDLQARFEL